MRLSLLAAVLLAAATPLAAQQPGPGVVVHAALADTSERLASYRVVGDTAWATVVRSRGVATSDPRKGIPAKEVRLERRGTAWAPVATRPILVQPPLSSLMSLPVPEPRWESDSGLTDTAALKQMAGGVQGIDTAKATLRFAGDTGWITSKRPNGSTTVRAVRDGSRWRAHSTEDTDVFSTPATRRP